VNLIVGSGGTAESAIGKVTGGRVWTQWARECVSASGACSMIGSGVGPSGSHVHGEGIVVVHDSDAERSLSGIVRKVGDEVGGHPCSAVVFAVDLDVSVRSAGGVVRVSVGVKLLGPEDEDVLGFGVGDSLESGEGHWSNIGEGERSGDGDESGFIATEGQRACGVDGVSRDFSLGSAGASKRDVLSGPVGLWWFRSDWCRSVGDWCRVIAILGKGSGDECSDQFHRYLM
jgi:hypothetical protein